MEIIQTLGTALGMGALCGIDLYLTVFVTGLAIRMKWIVLAPHLAGLGVLGDNWIPTLSGFLYFLEFFADKVPWVDSLWDAVHTVIRPIGAAFASTRMLGQTNPVFEVVIALLAGGAALSTHTVKAGTRTMINLSPEPASNIGMSLVEDVGVLGGLFVVFKHPGVALAMVIVFAIIFALVGPTLFRAVKANLFYIRGKLAALGGSPGGDVQLESTLPHHLDTKLFQARGKEISARWLIPSFTGLAKGTGSNLRGWLIRPRDENELYFVGSKWFRPVVLAVPLAGCKLDFRQKFMYDELVIYQLSTERKVIFRFQKSHGAEAEKAATLLRAEMQRSEPPAVLGEAAYQ